MVRARLELSNDVAREIAGAGDAVIRALERQLDCRVHLRGNVLTLSGSQADVAAGESVVREIEQLVERGHEIAPGTVEAVTRALDAREDPQRVLEDVIWQHRGTRIGRASCRERV